MKKKILFFSLIIILISGILYLIIINLPNDNEFIPEEEISEKDETSTEVTLFFENINTREIEEKPISLEPKQLLYDPYELLIEKLKENPNDNNYKSIFPESLNLRNVELNLNTLTIKLESENNESYSSDILEKLKEYCTKTMLQLNEIEKVRIFINDLEI